VPCKNRVLGGGGAPFFWGGCCLWRKGGGGGGGPRIVSRSEPKFSKRIQWSGDEISPSLNVVD